MSQEPIRFIEGIKLRRIVFLLILVMMCISGLVGSDLYLPMLPQMATIFNKSVSQIQFSLTVYLIGLSVSQVIYGPLCDRFGRKKMAIFGVSLYCITSVSAALSTTFFSLLVSRFFEAVGASSGLVIGRAIIGDTHDKQGAGKIFSTIFPFVGMSPAISPVIGGLIGVHFGWESCFWLLGFFCIVQLILISIFLKETIKSYSSIHPFKILSNYWTIIRSFHFWAYAFGPCFGYAVYFGYITESPFIFNTFGFKASHFAFFYIFLSATYVVGNLIGKKMLSNNSVDRCLNFGYLFFLLGGGSFLMLLFPFSLLTLLVIMIFSISVITFANGFLLPLGTAGVMSEFPSQGGIASGLLGFLQLGSAAIASLAINSISKVSISGLSYFIFPITLIAFMTFYIYRVSALRKASTS